MHHPSRSRIHHQRLPRLLLPMTRGKPACYGSSTTTSINAKVKFELPGQQKFLLQLTPHVLLGHTWTHWHPSSPLLHLDPIQKLFTSPEHFWVFPRHPLLSAPSWSPLNCNYNAGKVEVIDRFAEERATVRGDSIVHSCASIFLSFSLILSAIGSSSKGGCFSSLAIKELGHTILKIIHHPCL